MANVLTMITNLIKYLNNNEDPLNLTDYYKKINLLNSKHGKNTNSANKMGTPFEEFIKDLYANTLSIHNNDRRNKDLNKTFIYRGNSKNPPDAVLRGRFGDAIEFKKEQGNKDLQLNSSYFHHCLDSYDSRIDKSCKQLVSKDLNRYEWHKDLLYIIGNITRQKKFKSLIMFYGNDYAKDNSYYKNSEDQVYNMIFPKLWMSTVNNILNVLRKQCFQTPKLDKFKKDINDKLNDDGLTYLNNNTNEIGKVSNVDKTGTYLRIRGMWVMKNPIRLITSLMRPLDGIIKNRFSKIAPQQLSLKRPASFKTPNNILEEFFNGFNKKSRKFSLILIIDNDKLRNFKKSTIRDFCTFAQKTPNLHIIHIKLRDPNKKDTKIKYPRNCMAIIYTMKRR